MMRGTSKKNVIIKARIYMYYISNERDYYALSINVSSFENIYGGRKWFLKRYFFYFYF